ncbi:DnaJ family domain-containing protein [Microbacterium rhizophilus]|uniref:DnaJ family domain-containing protein n=1 Tax=Microbacterium rhizophilus TaxID=3138934 RepID=UPI0031F1408B
MTDPREAAARYRVERDVGQAAEDETPSWSTPEERAAVVEQAIQHAIRRGEFENLPGAGKPLTGLGQSHDPDWWIRRKIEQENLRGLGPPALALRVEDAELDDRLDRMTREQDVRETLEDFNRRVKHARLQLLGGPPVVTPTRDVEAEIAAWHERREERGRAAREAAAAEAPEPRRRRWRRRERA